MTKSGCLFYQVSPGGKFKLEVVQLLSHVQLFATPQTAACWASLSFTIYQSLLKLMFIMLVMLSNHLVLCHALLLLPSVFEIEIVRRQSSYSLWAPWLNFFLQEFSYVFFQVWPFIHIIANNRIGRNQFETVNRFYPDKLNTKEPVGTAKIWGPSV